MKLNLFSAAILALAVGCSPNSNKKTEMPNSEFQKGTFGYDYSFLSKYQKNIVLLTDSNTNAMVMVSPAYQGRVMTSSVSGMESKSNGWINYALIESGKRTDHINAFGGEERLWLGPEGGPFSLYFEPGKAQEFENWQVPAILDTLPFNLDSSSATSASFSALLNLKNFSGTGIQAKIERKVKLLNTSDIEKIIGLPLADSLNTVAYQSENTIINQGSTGWDTKTGMPSIWMLSMLTPSPEVTIFIPYNKGDEKTLGKVVSDDYFGKVPADRLKVSELPLNPLKGTMGIIYFKADGKHRSKIGLSPERATSWACSYDASRNALTLLYCDSPEGRTDYVNSKWGDQDDPFSGDAINAYNDGPVEDGSQMGPFYELESSSPAANLKPGEKLTHTQAILHIEGPEEKLDAIVQKLFSISITDIKTAFK